MNMKDQPHRPEHSRYGEAVTFNAHLNVLARLLAPRLLLELELLCTPLPQERFHEEHEAVAETITRLAQSCRCGSDLASR